MSDAGVDGSPATPADGGTACPWSPSPSTAAAAATIFSCGDATASWPGVAFPRRRANLLPVGGAGAVMMSPTPPRYLPRAAATSTGGPATTTATRASSQGMLLSLSESSSKVGEGLEKIYGSTKFRKGLAKVYGKAFMIGLAAADFCNRHGWSGIPAFFEEHVINSEWSRLPEFFKGFSCVLHGANEVIQGSSQAFSAMGVPTWLFHTFYAYIPSSSYTLPKAGRPHRAYAGGSCPQQGIHNVLPYHIIKRSCLDSVLVVQDNNGSRRSPKKVLPTVQTISTLAELNRAIGLFKNGAPVHLIDISENDVSLTSALDFWNTLLSEGATALLKRDSNLCRMSKTAYSLKEEKNVLESELITLKNKVDDIKNSIILVSDMLMNTKPKSAKLTGTSRRIDFTGVGDHRPSTSMESICLIANRLFVMPSTQLQITWKRVIIFDLGMRRREEFVTCVRRSLVSVWTSVIARTLKRWYNG